MKESSRARQVSGGRPPIYLVFGEDDHDRRAVSELVVGLRPDLAGRVQTRNRPLVLVKGVTPSELANRKAKLMTQIRADRVRFDVKAVLVHEDCDDVEPAHEGVERRYRQQFAGADVPILPVCPAWELEAWWLQWPRVLKKYRPAWHEPVDVRGTRVGLIRDAKEVLRKKLVPPGLGKRERDRFVTYVEADSPGIAATVREMNALTAPEAQSRSYDRFREIVEQM